MISITVSLAIPYAITMRRIRANNVHSKTMHKKITDQPIRINMNPIFHETCSLYLFETSTNTSVAAVENNKSSKVKSHIFSEKNQTQGKIKNKNELKHVCFFQMFAPFFIQLISTSYHIRCFSKSIFTFHGTNSFKK